MAAMKRLAVALIAAWIAVWLSPAIAAELGRPVVVAGVQRILVVTLRFPDVEPRANRRQIEKKAANLASYIRLASYGRATLEPRVVGWYDLPAPIADYRVSPYNFKVDRSRVRRLVADAIALARRDADPNAFAAVWLLLGAETRPGEGYGMIAYAANPGLLSMVRGGRARMEAVALPGGGSFDRPVIVSAENAHLGHVAHDLLHALGGASDGRRAVPDLYDFELQSDPPGGRMLPEIFAVHAGPWDIMSQHFIEWRRPPPQPSSFTRLQLGWIAPEQVVNVAPGEPREVTLAPLASGRSPLVVRIALPGGRYLLVENRQAVSGDIVLPTAGMLVLEVDPDKAEGAGIVRVADANPHIGRLYAAPFLPGLGERRRYQNSEAGVEITPLALEPGGDLKLRIAPLNR